MKNFQKREARKAPRVKPTLDELNFPTHSKLSRPKKSNKQALKRIQRGELLWDRKRIERIAQRRKNRLLSKEHVSITRHTIEKNLFNRIQKELTLWAWNEDTKSFQPKSAKTFITQAELVEISKVGASIEGGPIPLRIDYLTSNQALIVARFFPQGSSIQGLRNVSSEDEYTRIELQDKIGNIRRKIESKS